MFKYTLIGGLLVSAIALTACERRPANPGLPKAAETSAIPAAPVADKSLPPATAALNAPDGTPQKTPTGTQTMTPMSKSTESAAMPLPGQANDHSAPKANEAASAASR